MIENKDEIRLTVTIFIVAFSTFAVFLAAIILRRKSRTPCYLETDDSKPQTSFKLVLADNSYNAFKHLNRTQGKPSNSHPYESEITELLGSSHFDEFSVVNGEVDLKMKESYVWVDKEEQLLELEEVLSKESVFAVDTEQHSLRSFLGFTALMQISTRSEDYLVDTIALHDVMGILRPVFADPKICKVFHGAHNDVIWLQRDFHIYVVNLFDTAKACEVLSKPQKSLAYLLETYCGVLTNKKLQLGDWRLRPLSEELIEYARADAHYLLYIAYCMANELKVLNIENPECLDDKFHFVLETRRRSNMICLQLYTKEIEATPGKSAASSILSRHVNGQGVVSTELVERLCMWRDLMARVHDESLRYVLSNQAIVSLASKASATVTEISDMIFKADVDSDTVDVDSTLSSSSPVVSSYSSPSPVVSSHLEDICDLLANKISNVGDLETIIRKHLGPNGSCPLSIYNYALLKKSNLNVSNGFSAKRKEVNPSKRFGRKASRQLFVQKFSCKAPVYHNCRIYASDGRMLCYCDRRKLEWYLRRDLAELVHDDPPAIKLLFEPKGRPEDEDNDFYIQSKKNMCVGCGEKNHYLRYRIIPSCYRVHFPEHLKSHRSHDIVLLCVDCHEIAHSAAEKYKRQISAEFGIPLFVSKVTDSGQPEAFSGTSASGENVDEAGVCPSQLRTAAMALLRHGSNMPAKRHEELTQTVMKFFGGRKISEEDLERALLVGMSPRERKRLEKKRGLSLRHSTGGHLSNNGRDDNIDSLNVSVHAEAVECDTTEGSRIARGGEHSKGENLYIRNCCDSEVKATATDGENLQFDKTTIGKKENILDTDEDLESKMLSDGVSQRGSNGTTSSTYSHKLSLLGHGPHGKQVVDHLLEEFGEDGIRVFCQRWRHVFVESINPRFLPSGWDVMHRGRREFGDYSVYNPLKKAPTTATV